MADMNFLSLNKNKTLQNQMKSISYAYIVTGSLSTIGAASIVIVTIIKKKICSPEICPLFQLSLADLLASVLLLSISILYNILLPHHNGVAVYCQYITGMIACFYVITFLLTVTYAFEVYFKMRARFQQRSELTVIPSNFPILYFMYATSWLLPILTIGVNFAISADHDNTINVDNANLDLCNSCLPVFHYSSQDCYKPKDPHKDMWNQAYMYLFLLSLVSAIFMIIVIYMLVIRKFKKAQLSRGVVSASQHREERRVRRIAVLFQLAFIFCWLPSIVLGFLALTKRDFTLSKYYIAYIIQASISPLQGFFNCFIYGWKRKGFQKAISDSLGESTF